jgi:hypothetical protein
MGIPPYYFFDIIILDKYVKNVTKANLGRGTGEKEPIPSSGL